MGKLFERMYIGNPNKKDLTKKDVAAESRLRLFFTVLRVRGMKLMGLNLLYVLFLLPTLLVIYLALFQYALSTAENPMGFEDVMMYLYLLFPCMLIAAPGTLGFTNVLHRWANDEHAWTSDFWVGIKKNWKQGLIVTAINYIVLLLLIYCAYFYMVITNNQSEDPTLNTFFSAGLYISYFIIGCIFVFFMMHMYIFPLLVRYKLKLKQIYKYSFILAFRNLFGSIACVVFAMAVLYAMLFVPYVWYTIFVIGLVLPYLAIYVFIGGVFNKQVFIDVKEY